jgi:hypothetical protein
MSASRITRKRRRLFRVQVAVPLKQLFQPHAVYAIGILETTESHVLRGGQSVQCSYPSKSVVRLEGVLYAPTQRLHARVGFALNGLVMDARIHLLLGNLMGGVGKVRVEQPELHPCRGSDDITKKEAGGRAHMIRPRPQRSCSSSHNSKHSRK